MTKKELKALMEDILANQEDTTESKDEYYCTPRDMAAIGLELLANKLNIEME